jgi:hypothetical protein
MSLHLNAKIVTIAVNLAGRSIPLLGLKAGRRPGEFIVLCQPGGVQPYVTWRTTDGQDTCLGHYASDLATAEAEFGERG